MKPVSAPLPRPRLDARAQADLDLNVVDGRYFGAGRSFGSTVFTRDLALSGVLALNRLRPREMRESLRFDRELRHAVGWQVIAGSSAVDIPGLPFVDSGLDFDSFLIRHRTNDFSRRSDDVVWIWAYADWILANAAADVKEWAWLLDQGWRCYDAYYAPFHDPVDGLYRGQSCFLDVMMCGYPAEREAGDPRDAADFRIHHLDGPDDHQRWAPPGLRPASLSSCLLGKAASTNALHLIALAALAEAAGRCGADPVPWLERRDRLRSALRSAFLREDGTVLFARSGDGTPIPRQHALATAFAVLSGALDGNEARAALAAYPARPWGSPLFEPFYLDNPHRYHNHSCWPFADAFLGWAQWCASGGDPSTLDRWEAVLAHACDGGAGFRELIDAYDGSRLGSAHQLWSAAGWLGAGLARTCRLPAAGGMVPMIDRSPSASLAMERRR